MCGSLGGYPLGLNKIIIYRGLEKRGMADAGHRASEGASHSACLPRLTLPGIDAGALLVLSNASRPATDQAVASASNSHSLSVQSCDKRPSTS
jgi:hypothetical protein